MAQFNSRGRLWRAHSMKMRACLVVCAALLSTGCASQSYMGISLVPGQASAEVQELARRAQTGDKRAQLDLGIRYEEGTGVIKDIKQAVRLYRLASADIGGDIWVYAPPIGNQTSGRMIHIDRGQMQGGLKEAKLRLNLYQESRK